MKKLNFLLLSMAFSLLSANGVQAQKINIKDTPLTLTLPDNATYDVKSYNGQTSIIPLTAKPVTEQEMVEVTLNIKSVNGINPLAGGLVSSNGLKLAIDVTKQTQTIKLPAGTYDMYVHFYGQTSYYVFKEDVVVENGTTLEFSPEEATNSVTINTYDENDEELFYEIYDGNSLVEKGTTQRMLKMTSFIHKDYNGVSLNLGMGNKQVSHPQEFFVNNISSDYIIGTGILATMKDGTMYVFKNEIKNIEPEITVKLGGKDRLVETNTKLDVVDYREGVRTNMRPGCVFTIAYNGLMVGSTEYQFYIHSKDKLIRCLLDTPVTESGFNVLFNPNLTNDFSETKYPNGATSRDDYKAVGPTIVGNKETGALYANTGLDFSKNGLNTSEELQNNIMFPGHPELSFVSKSTDVNMGNSCPLITIKTGVYKQEGTAFGSDTSVFTGRFGETLGADAHKCGIEIDYVDGNYVGVVNNENVKVDGMEGFCKAVYTFDTSSDDMTAPTPTMLTIKDSEGNINDHLEDVEGAKIIMTGGDFTYYYTQETNFGYYTCGDAEAKIQYAPMGTNEWKDLVVVQIPENKLMPYFGNYYEASLDNVKVLQKDQWFDLRIEMKDKAGYVHTQTMSPVFKVANVDSGINEITEANANLYFMSGNVKISTGEVADFKVINMAGTEVRSAFGEEISIEGLNAGAYIVTAKTAENGVLTKKILVK